MNLDIDRALSALADNLVEHCQKKQITNPIVVGIHSGGVWVAERILSQLATQEALATLDITFYRDDFSRMGLHPKVKQTVLPPTEDRHVILIDDVLMSGRTIRAAMNEIFDFGRPASISLAILYDLHQAELPIHADAVGEVINLSATQRIKLSGPSPLVVNVVESA